MKQRQTWFIAAALTGVLLTGCSGHQNPLNKPDKTQAAKFLVHASQVAEKKLNLGHPPGGYFYGECMQGKAKGAVCDKLYQAMVNYAKKTKGFESLTQADLTNPNTFERLKDDYERQAFDTI